MQAVREPGVRLDLAGLAYERRLRHANDDQHLTAALTCPPAPDHHPRSTPSRCALSTFRPALRQKPWIRRLWPQHHAAAAASRCGRTIRPLRQHECQERLGGGSLRPRQGYGHSPPENLDLGVALCEPQAGFFQQHCRLWLTRRTSHNRRRTGFFWSTIRWLRRVEIDQQRQEHAGNEKTNSHNEPQTATAPEKFPRFSRRPRQPPARSCHNRR